VEHGGVEREAKLEAGIGFRIPDLDGVALGVTARSEPEQRLQAVYVDTSDLRLIRGGLTLRHRAERRPGATPGEWTLKLPEKSASPGLSRREINWPGPGGSVPAHVAGLVRAYRRTAPLGPVARLVTHRRRTVLCGRAGEPLLEIDDDVVSVMDGRRLAARFREVEVEVVGAAPDYLLDAVLAHLGEAGAIASDGRAKVVRAIGPRATEPPDVTPVDVDRNSSIGEVVRAAIAHGYLRLVAHDLGVRLDEDPEDVHQARVATRRLRSDLRTFRAYLPGDWARETRTELGWVADALGRARDADVLFERLHGQVDTLDRRDAEAAGQLLGRLVAEQAEARQALMKVLDTDRYGALLDRLAAAARELPPMKAPGELRAAPQPGAGSAAGPAPANGPDPTLLEPVEANGAPAAVEPVTALGEPAGVGPAPILAAAEPTGRGQPDGPPLAPAEPTGRGQPAGPPSAPAEPTGRGQPAGPPSAPAEPTGPGQPAGPPSAPAEPSGLGPAGPTATPVASGLLITAPAGVAPPPDPAGQPAPGAPAVRSERLVDRNVAARHEAPGIVRGPWRHLSQAVHALGPDPSADALHEVRIRGKRLRYASEAVAPAAGKPAVALARAAADLQGILGDFHDAIVAEGWLRTGSENATPASALAAGQLIARERDDAAQSRASWPKAWKRLKRKKWRAWLT
jgi:CHAD domain-containing protein